MNNQETRNKVRALLGKHNEINYQYKAFSPYSSDRKPGQEHKLSLHKPGIQKGHTIFVEHWQGSTEIEVWEKCLNYMEKRYLS